MVALTKRSEDAPSASAWQGPWREGRRSVSSYPPLMEAQYELLDTMVRLRVVSGYELSRLCGVNMRSVYRAMQGQQCLSPATMNRIMHLLKLQAEGLFDPQTFPVSDYWYAYRHTRRDPTVLLEKLEALKQERREARRKAKENAA